MDVISATPKLNLNKIADLISERELWKLHKNFPLDLSKSYVSYKASSSNGECMCTVCSCNQDFLLSFFTDVLNIS